MKIHSVHLLAMAASCAQAVSSLDTCETTTTLPVITAYSDGGPTEYVQSFTTVYSEFCPEGLRPATYTITETCTKTLCQPHTGTEPPSGFTRATVVCANCGTQGPMTETLTFPNEAVSSYSASGYTVIPANPSNSVATQALESSSGSQPGSSSSVNAGSYSESNPTVASNVATSTTQVAIVPASSGTLATSGVSEGSSTATPVAVAAANELRPGLIALGVISIAFIAIQLV